MFGAVYFGVLLANLTEKLLDKLIIQATDKIIQKKADELLIEKLQKESETSK